MNSLDLALKKQRLLLESERLREKFARNGRGVQPAFQAADLAVAGVLHIPIDELDWELLETIQDIGHEMAKGGKR